MPDFRATALFRRKAGHRRRTWDAYAKTVTRLAGPTAKRLTAPAAVDRHAVARDPEYEEPRLHA